MSTDAPSSTQPRSLSDRALDTIERTGNALPDPVTLFFIFIAIVMVASWITHVAGVSVVHPGTEEVITADNLFSAENIQRLFTDMAETFASFPPLGAVLFYGVGRHPLAGLAAAFAGVSAGFSANLSLTSLDPLLASFTEPAAQLIDPSYTVPVTANWWIMIALTPVFIVVGTYITERIVEPYLGDYDPSDEVEVDVDAPDELTPLQWRGLRWAGGVRVAC